VGDKRSDSLIIPRAAVEDRGEDIFIEGVVAPLAFANLSSTPVPRAEIGKS
jgi:hypothetical protein